MSGLGALLRLAAVTALVLWVGQRWGAELVQAGVPGVTALIGITAADFQILGVALVKAGPDTSLEVRAMLAHVVLFDGRAVVPDGRTGYAVTTALGTMLQPAATAAIVALAWPGGWRVTLPRAVLVVPAALVACALDAPFYLAGSLWDMQMQRHDPDGFSPLVWWMHLLAGGGRLALGVTAGALAVALAGVRWAPSTASAAVAPSEATA